MTRARPIGAAFTGILLGLVLAIAVGWAVLALGGHTDASGRMGILAGIVLFTLIGAGWGRGPGGWLRGAAAAAVIGAAVLLHFWMRVGRLP